MMVIDKDFTIENINQKGLDLFGLVKEDVLGRKCYQVIRKMDYPESICPVYKALNTEKPESAEWYGKQLREVDDDIALDISVELHKSAQQLHVLLENLLTWSQLQQGSLAFGRYGVRRSTYDHGGFSESSLQRDKVY